MITIFRIAFVTLVTLQFSGCALLYKYEAISEQPVRSPANAPLQPQLSTIQPSLNVPLSLLQDAANTAASKVLPINQNGRERIASLEIMKPWPFSGCWICEYLDADWRYTVTQPSPIAVTGKNNQLVVELSAALDGGAGFNGEIAKWASLNDKRFAASAVMEFKTGLGADARYCPVLRGLSIDYRWAQVPYVQLVGRTCVLGGGFCFGPWNLEFGSQVDGAVRPQLANVAAGLQQNIPCEPIRSGLANLWKPYSVPVKLPYEQLYLNITPQALYFPGLDVTTENIAFAGRFDANVSLDPTPIPTNPLPLPENKPLPISPGTFSLAVPISTQYYTVNALAKQVLDQQKFRTSTPLGDVIVTPMNVELYPTANGGQLALGVQVAVEFQYLFFLNTSGTVWLTATPATADSGRRLRLTDVRVTRKFSNQVWNFASALLDGAIGNAVRDGFELDLNEPIRNAEREVATLLNSAGQGSGIEVSAKDVKITAGRMLANDKAFQLEAIVSAIVQAKIASVSQP